MITNEEVKNILNTLYAGSGAVFSPGGELSKSKALKALDDGNFDNDPIYRRGLWNSLHKLPLDILTLLKLNERFPHPDPEVQKYIHPASITFNEKPIHVIFIDALKQALGNAVGTRKITFEQFEFLMNEIDKIATDKAKAKGLDASFINDTLSKVKAHCIAQSSDSLNDEKDTEQPKSKESKDEQPQSEQPKDERSDSSATSLAEQGTNLLQALVRLIDEGESYDDIKEALFDTYPEIDQAKLEEELDRAVYITATCNRNGSAQ